MSVTPSFKTHFLAFSCRKLSIIETTEKQIALLI